MQYGRTFPRNGAVYGSCVRLAILNGSEASCLRESEMVCGFDVHVGFKLNNRSDDYGKFCSLVWLCLEKGIIFCG